MDLDGGAILGVWSDDDSSSYYSDEPIPGTEVRSLQVAIFRRWQVLTDPSQTDDEAIRPGSSGGADRAFWARADEPEAGCHAGAEVHIAS